MLGLGIMVGGIFGLLGQQEMPLIRHLDHVVLDTYLKFSAADKPAKNTIIVDIDAASLDAMGQWPWPRYRTASLIEAIAKKKPAAIGVDIIFPEPDRISLDNVQKNFKKDFGIDIAFSGAPPGLLDNDGYLGSVLMRTGTVGAQYFYFDHNTKTASERSSGFQINDREKLLALPEATGVLENTPVIAKQLAFFGFINARPDDDGMLRSLPLLLQYAGNIYPHLSLAVYMRATQVSTATVGSDRHGPFIRVGRRIIPIDRNGRALLRFDSATINYPSVSAIDVLSGKAGDSLRGKSVLIGSSATGLHDLHNTLFDAQLPGTVAQTAMIENMNAGNFVRTPNWDKILTLALCVLFGALLSLLFIAVTRPIPLIIGSLFLVLLPFLGSLYCFAAFDLFVSPASIILAVTTLFVVFSLMRYAVERRRSHAWIHKFESAKKLTIESMANMAELRHHETGAHIKRTQFYVREIAQQLKNDGHYLDTLTHEYIELLVVLSPLHDIGKVGVPDAILLKPAPLTPDEWTLMKKHAEYGSKIIGHLVQTSIDDDCWKIAKEIALTHHERWDGKGYPQGLSEQDIPLSGRIMAVADVYDALISKRCYQDACSHDKALSIMFEGRGTNFDPLVFDAFLHVEAKIVRIAESYKDQDHDMIEVFKFS